MNDNIDETLCHNMYVIPSPLKEHDGRHYVHLTYLVCLLLLKGLSKCFCILNHLQLKPWRINTRSAQDNEEKLIITR